MLLISYSVSSRKAVTSGAHQSSEYQTFSELLGITGWCQAGRPVSTGLTKIRLSSLVSISELPRNPLTLSFSSDAMLECGKPRYSVVPTLTNLAVECWF